MIEPKSRLSVSVRMIRVLRSKRIRLAFATLIVSVLVLAIPELEAIQDEMMMLITALLLAFVSDSVRVARNGTGTTSEESIDEEV